MSKFLTQNKNWILIGVGVGFQVGGTLAAISATKATNKEIDEKEKELNRKLTKSELALIFSRNYAPTAVFQAVGIGCIVSSAHNMNTALNSALLTASNAYTTLNTYKEKTKEVLGEKAANKVNEAVAQKKVDDDANKYKYLVPTEGKKLFKEPITGIEFLSTWNDIEKAAIYCNKESQSCHGITTVKDWLDALHIDETDEHIFDPNRAKIHLALDQIGWKNGILIKPIPSSCMKGDYPIGMIEYEDEPTALSRGFYD